MLACQTSLIIQYTFILLLFDLQAYSELKNLGTNSDEYTQVAKSFVSLYFICFVKLYVRKRKEL